MEVIVVTIMGPSGGLTRSGANEEDRSKRCPQTPTNYLNIITKRTPQSWHRKRRIPRSDAFELSVQTQSMPRVRS